MRQTNGGIVFDQRDIVLLPFPYSDLTGAKQRPALILSNKKLNISEDRICCLITSNVPQDGLLLDASAFEQGTLPFKSWVKPHRIFTVHEKIIKKKLCAIRSEHYQMVLNYVVAYIQSV